MGAHDLVRFYRADVRAHDLGVRTAVGIADSSLACAVPAACAPAAFHVPAEHCPAVDNFVVDNFDYTAHSCFADEMAEALLTGFPSVAAAAASPGNPWMRHLGVGEDILSTEEAPTPHIALKAAGRQPTFGRTQEGKNAEAPSID